MIKRLEEEERLEQERIAKEEEDRLAKLLLDPDANPLMDGFPDEARGLSIFPEGNQLGMPSAFAEDQMVKHLDAQKPDAGLPGASKKTIDLPKENRKGVERRDSRLPSSKQNLKSQEEFPKPGSSQEIRQKSKGELDAKQTQARQQANLKENNSKPQDKDKKNKVEVTRTQEPRKTEPARTIDKKVEPNLKKPADKPTNPPTQASTKPPADLPQTQNPATVKQTIKALEKQQSVKRDLQADKVDSSKKIPTPLPDPQSTKPPLDPKEPVSTAAAKDGKDTSNGILLQKKSDKTATANRGKEKILVERVTADSPDAANHEFIKSQTGVSIEKKLLDPNTLGVQNDKFGIKPTDSMASGNLKSQESKSSRSSLDKNEPQVDNKPSIQQLVSVPSLPQQVQHSERGDSNYHAFTIREQTEPDPTYQPTFQLHLDSVDLRLHKTEPRTDRNIEMLLAGNEERVNLDLKPCFSNFLLTREALQQLYVKKEEQKLEENNKEIALQENKKYQELYEQVAAEGVVHQQTDATLEGDWFVIEAEGEIGRGRDSRSK